MLLCTDLLITICSCTNYLVLKLTPMRLNHEVIYHYYVSTCTKAMTHIYTHHHIYVCRHESFTEV